MKCRKPTPTEIKQVLEAARKLTWAPSWDSGHLTVDILTWVLTGKEQGGTVGFWKRVKKTRRNTP